MNAGLRWPTVTFFLQRNIQHCKTPTEAEELSHHVLFLKYFFSLILSRSSNTINGQTCAKDKHTQILWRWHRRQVKIKNSDQKRKTKTPINQIFGHQIISLKQNLLFTVSRCAFLCALRTVAFRMSPGILPLTLVVPKFHWDIYSSGGSSHISIFTCDPLQSLFFNLYLKWAMDESYHSVSQCLQKQ